MAKDPLSLFRAYIARVRMVMAGEPNKQELIKALKKTGGVQQCGVCHTTSDLVGPFVGGLCNYYCKKCHEIIQKWEALKREHQDRLTKYVAIDKVIDNIKYREVESLEHLRASVEAFREAVAGTDDKRTALALEIVLGLIDSLMTRAARRSE